MADTDSYDVPSPSPFDIATAAAAGPAKALSTAKDARDQSASGVTAGSGYNMSAARAQDTTAGDEWKTIWTDGTTAMNAWKTANNSVNGNAWLWFVQAAALGDAVAAWHTKWTDDGTELTVGDGAFVESLVKETGGGADDGLCNKGSQSGGAWNTANTDAIAAGSEGTSAAGIAACKTACEKAAFNALVVNPNTDGTGSSTSTADNGGQTMGAYATDVSAAWCGGYTWEDANSDAALKCQLLLGSDDPAAPTSSSAADRCSKMTTVKAFADLTATLFSTWGAVTNTLYTNLATAADSQAALEKAWLQAWYEQQYWAAIKVQLTTAATATEATSDNTMSAYVHTRVISLGTSGTSDDSNVAGAEAATSTATTSLNNATEQLATLQANNAAAAATVAALGTRIKASTTQITELNDLANSDGDGTLDEAAALRSAEHAAYTNDGSANGSVKGEAVEAADELAAANAAVAAAVNTDPEGALLAARTQAQGTWTQAKSDASDAEGALTNALGTAVLVELR